ncbi:MAG: hypothetical protein HY722_12940 [Planctomycetes bacterium]|nr:hypothetical protein [Planctomycetota bacterium]
MLQTSLERRTWMMLAEGTGGEGLSAERAAAEERFFGEPVPEEGSPLRSDALVSRAFLDYFLFDHVPAAIESLLGGLDPEGRGTAEAFRRGSSGLYEVLGPGPAGASGPAGADRRGRLRDLHDGRLHDLALLDARRELAPGGLVLGRRTELASGPVLSGWASCPPERRTRAERILGRRFRRYRRGTGRDWWAFLADQGPELRRVLAPDHPTSPTGSAPSHRGRPVSCLAQFAVSDPTEVGRLLATLTDFHLAPPPPAPPRPEDGLPPLRYEWRARGASRRLRGRASGAALGEVELGGVLVFRAPDLELFRIGLALLECAATGFIRLQHATVGAPRPSH